MKIFPACRESERLPGIAQTFMLAKTGAILLLLFSSAARVAEW
ncbi:hypothetical protein M2103_002334 [Ereboglobus sp. PH5-5]|nr:MULTISPECIES: hypothetical protein [unclassified Ereboglobus]MDF9827454.1 hypothetical protein [Ereboglobus sp. PH5-10]MDF9834097.1 hypothetical protein [Ereboglobus sp. PH5-5]